MRNQPDPTGPGRPSPDPESTDEAHAQRAEALAALAHAQAQAQPPTPPQTYRSDRLTPCGASSRRWLLIGGAIALLIALVGSLAGYVALQATHGTLSRATPPSVLTLDLGRAGFSCPSALAWSPDGARVAVVAMHGFCNGTSGGDWDAVLLYDATSGKLLRALDLQGAMASAHIGLMQPTLNWSPDGQWVALRADAYTQPGAPGHPALVLLPTDGGPARTFIADTLTEAILDAPIWEVSSGKVTSVLAYPLPLALTYAWTADGRITPQAPMPTVTAGATPSTPGGSFPFSVGDQHTFPLYQDGAVGSLLPYPGPDRATGPVIDFSASATLWSADGRYVVPALALGRAVFPARAEDLAKITSEACVTYGLAPCATPLAPVPYPDAAIRQIAGQVAAQPLLGAKAAPVSWRPDRQLVATILPGDGAAPEVHVSLLDTSTGETVKEVSVRFLIHDYMAQAGSLRWSPTGQQLALMDPLGTQITVWGASSLPR